MIEDGEKMQCYCCKQNLRGTLSGKGFHRAAFYSLVFNKCKSPYFENEKDKDTIHFCSFHCMKKFVNSIEVVTGSPGSASTRTSGEGEKVST